VNAAPADAGPTRGPQRARSLILFRLDDLRAAVAESAVVEIVAAVQVRPLPRQPKYIAGVFDLRGTIVPVLDLRARFGIASRPIELSDHFIVVRAAGRLLAVWVDAVEGFAHCAADAWNAAGGLVVGDRSLAGVATLADGLATIHDVDAFVAQCEADAVFEAAAS
jgi:purine-binding chemotaxis protein CheW